MKKTIFLLFFALFAGISSLTTFGQSGQDTMFDRLSSQSYLYEYYYAQSRKTRLPEAQQTKFKSQKEALEEELFQINSQLYSYPINKDSLILDIQSFYNEFPSSYGYEPGSLLINGGGSFMGKQFSWPVMLFVEKAFHEKVCGGFYVSYFVEKNRTKKLLPEQDAYYNLTKFNYIYKYFSFGVRGTWHFFDIAKPPMKLYPQNFDLYASVLAGYNMAFPVANYLEKSLYNTDPATRSGINAGVMAGLRYIPDFHLGVFAEAGYSRNGFFTIGVTYRIVEHPAPAVKKEAEPSPGDEKPYEDFRKMETAKRPTAEDIEKAESMRAQIEAQKAEEAALAARRAQEDSLNAVKRAEDEAGKKLSPAEETEKINKVMADNKVSSDSLQMVAKVFEEMDKAMKDSSSRSAFDDAAIEKYKGIAFRIQIFAVSKELSDTSSGLRGLTGISMYQDAGMYKYTIGETKNLKEAYLQLADIRGKGFSDAFLAVFKNGKRISIQEALKSLNIKRP